MEQTCTFFTILFFFHSLVTHKEDVRRAYGTMPFLYTAILGFWGLVGADPAWRRHCLLDHHSPDLE